MECFIWYLITEKYYIKHEQYFILHSNIYKSYNQLESVSGEPSKYPNTARDYTYLKLKKEYFIRYPTPPPPTSLKI